MRRKAFILTFSVVLILFFMVFGICESYIAMQNTLSKDKITSVSEAFIDKEKRTADIHFFGEKLFSVRLYDADIPSEFSAFVPPELRILWIATEKGHREVSFFILNQGLSSAVCGIFGEILYHPTFL